MLKIKKSPHKSIKLNLPVHLYMDDLLTIEGILKDELKVRTLNVSFDDYEATSFKDIPEETIKVNRSLEIQTFEPFISITFNKFITSIWVSNSTLEIEGTVAKIKDLLKEKERKISFYLYKIINLASFLITLLISASFSWWLKKLGNNNQIIYLLLFYLFNLILWILTTAKPVRSIIEFQKKKNAPSFFERNKDQITVGLIVGIIVAIFSFTIGLYLGK